MLKGTVGIASRVLPPLLPGSISAWSTGFHSIAGLVLGVPSWLVLGDFNLSVTLSAGWLRSPWISPKSLMAQPTHTGNYLLVVIFVSRPLRYDLAVEHVDISPLLQIVHSLMGF